MFKTHRNAAQIPVTFLIIGWLILGAPTAAIAAGDREAPVRSLDSGPTPTTNEDSEVDEPPPDPFAAQPGAVNSVEDEDSEVDEPPPDPLSSSRWLKVIVSRLTCFF